MLNHNTLALVFASTLAMGVGECDLPDEPTPNPSETPIPSDPPTPHPSETSTPVTGEDYDGDGWMACTGEVDGTCDCDDREYYINPDQQERCDGVDTDCDGYSNDESGLITSITDWGYPKLENSIEDAVASVAGRSGTVYVCGGRHPGFMMDHAYGVDVIGIPQATIVSSRAMTVDSEPVAAGILINDGAGNSISNFTIEQVMTDNPGGGLAIWEAQDITLNNVNVIGCEASRGGGAWVVDTQNLVWRDSQVLANVVEATGGGLFLNDKGYWVENDHHANENQYGNPILHSYTTLENVFFTANVAGTKGHELYTRVGDGVNEGGVELLLQSSIVESSYGIPVFIRDDNAYDAPVVIEMEHSSVEHIGGGNNEVRFHTSTSFDFDLGTLESNDGLLYGIECRGYPERTCTR